MESRRHSLDSQVSVQIAEVTATRKAAATPMPAKVGGTGVRGKKTRNRHHRREFRRTRSSRVGPLIVRRGSTTSQESQLGAQVLYPQDIFKFLSCDNRASKISPSEYHFNKAKGNPSSMDVVLHIISNQPIIKKSPGKKKCRGIDIMKIGIKRDDRSY